LLTLSLLVPSISVAAADIKPEAKVDEKKDKTEPSTVRHRRVVQPDKSKDDEKGKGKNDEKPPKNKTDPPTVR